MLNKEICSLSRFSLYRIWGEMIKKNVTEINAPRNKRGLNRHGIFKIRVDFMERLFPVIIYFII